MTDTTATYTVQLANTPDGDGDYRAEVLRNGELTKTVFRRDRDAALVEARAWVERDRGHDPDDCETVTL